MHVPRFALLKFSSWWSRPKSCAISWHMPSRRHAGVLYVAVLKYVSFIFAVPLVMCVPPVTDICAMPSQPFLPYLAFQTSMRPVVARQTFGLPAPPATFVRFSTEDGFQSAMAPFRYASHTDDTLSPTFSVNGFEV